MLCDNLSNTDNYHSTPPNVFCQKQSLKPRVVGKWLVYLNSQVGKICGETIKLFWWSVLPPDKLKIWESTMNERLETKPYFSVIEQVVSPNNPLRTLRTLRNWGTQANVGRYLCILSKLSAEKEMTIYFIFISSQKGNIQRRTKTLFIA